MAIFALFSPQQNTLWSKIFEDECDIWNQMKVVQEGKLEVSFKVPIFSFLINIGIET